MQLVMQNCSKEALFWLFYNVSTTFLFLLLFLHFSFSILLSFLSFVGRYPLLQRDHNEEYVFTSDEEEDTEEEEEEEDGEGGEQEESYYHHHVPPAVMINTRTDHDYHDLYRFSEFGPVHHDEPDLEPVTTLEDDDDDSDGEVFSSAPDSLGGFESDIHADPVNVAPDHPAPNGIMPTSRVTMNQYYVKQNSKRKKKVEDEEEAMVDEKFLVFEPTQLDSRKYPHQAYQWKDIIDADKEEDDEDREETEEIFGDSCTVGSTSKSSTEWRSSIRDSGTDQDPFSSSSRRSCPKWESYTVFQKYDEEMIFLNRISAQKLQETESLRSIKVCPRSISDRIVHKISTLNKKPNSETRQNPYHELEAAYAAQICLTWEALNWNYINFQGKKASHRDSDPGCPAHIAQQFQQFQVLLQRYVENEPYEHGRRPEVYARMRLLAPKLLLVPEYRDSEDDQREDQGLNSRITSAEFLMIMEDGIKTFMNFLKADKEKPCQIIASFFKRNRRGSVDPALLNLVKKINRKKKMKLKDLRRSGKCLRKRKMKVEEEMEILMGLIDLQVVSRVLRTSDLSEQQLHWCEEKMSRVRLVDGKLKRDPSPLFFPAH
ncbi:hypothetical protein LINGRAHAP2_LOCUS17043 [Linum grandiflorum]